MMPMLNDINYLYYSLYTSSPLFLFLARIYTSSLINSLYFLNTIIKVHSLKATNFTHSNAKYSEIDLRVRALLSAAKALNFLAKSLTELESCFIFLLRIRERKKKSWLDCLLHLFHFSSLQEFQGFLLQHWWFFGL